MKLGLHTASFNPAGGASAIAGALKNVAQFVDENGFAALSVMDHFFQIQGVGPVEDAMLEGYSALNYVAALTSRIKLFTLVTGVIYRHPGLLAKTATTLDVLSGGRSYFGIGAAWNERESVGLGVRFPPLRDRFEMLEEALQIVLQMWSGEVKPYQGKHYQLAETLNSPMPLTKPHPPILIGGGGETKTLRLVAKYADACNLFMSFDDETIQRKLDALKRHCDDAGRDLGSIDLTATGNIDPDKQSAAEIIAYCQRVAKHGFTLAMLRLPNPYDMRGLELLAREVIPELA